MLIFHLDNILKSEQISQTKFADYCHVRPNTISDICNNKIKRLEIKTFNKIMKQLTLMGYSINDFMEYIL